VKKQRAATAKRAAAVEAALTAAYPNATCELDFRNPYELLVATILSAQCTDSRVNQVTPALFVRFPDPTALADAEQTELEAMIRSTGFYRNKAKSLIGMARAVVEGHGGDIPPRMDDLTQLPGVGRKTANVVLGTALGLSTGVVVDTHVARLAKRLGLSTQSDPDKIEKDLMELFPPSSWVALSHRLILHGRRVCHARKPDCDHCPLAALCPRIGL
jgi:endonuclease-3